MQPTDFQDSSNQYAQGLIDGDSQALQAIFKEMRPAIMQGVQSVGGSHADGNVFFQTALVDAAQMARMDKLPVHLPLQEVITVLAQLHFTQWASKHQDPPPIPIEQPDWAPTPEILSDTRKHIFVWKTMSKIEASCHSTLWEQPVDPQSTCAAELSQQLNARKVPTEDTTAATEVLPDYALTALKRKEDYGIWATIRQFEDNLERGLQIDGTDTPRPKDNTILRSALLMMLFLTLGFGINRFMNRTKHAKEVFENNFAPPESLMADLNRRLEHDSSDIVRPDACNAVFAEADVHYSKKNYSAAFDLLLQMADLEDLAACRSDALFGLCIISLKREEPGEALQYLAKIDNIEAYGEDLYWYQALAFVQRAKQQNAYTPAAIGALGRFLENTRDEKRRLQAEEMLQNLGK